jgi:hypothetical protein
MVTTHVQQQQLISWQSGSYNHTCTIGPVPKVLIPILAFDLTEYQLDTNC